MGKEKQVSCIDCGKEITVSIFASPKKARCQECKGGGTRSETPAPAPAAIEQEAPAAPAPEAAEQEAATTEKPARLDKQPNKALQNLNCPYCKTPMTLISVIHSSMWGDMITMQCRNKGCYIKVEINERDRIEAPIKATPCGTGYDVAMTPEELLDSLAAGDISRKFVNKLQRL